MADKFTARLYAGIERSTGIVPLINSSNTIANIYINGKKKRKKTQY